jgi:hypothetical protein
MVPFGQSGPDHGADNAGNQQLQSQVVRHSVSSRITRKPYVKRFRLSAHVPVK